MRRRPFDLGVVRRALDRVGDGREEHVGRRDLQVVDGRLQVLGLLGLVAEHDEHADLDAARLQQARRVLHLLDGDAPVHRVQHALGAALRSDPQALAAEPRERLHRVLGQAVGPRDALEGHAQGAARHLVRQRAHEAGVDGEHVVDVPELVGPVALGDPLHLVRHVRGRAPPVRLAEHGAAAPAAGERAAARGGQRDRAEAVRAAPGLEVGGDVDRLAVGPGLGVEVAQQRARPRPHHPALFVAVHDARHVGPVAPARPRQQQRQRAQRASPPPRRPPPRRSRARGTPRPRWAARARRPPRARRGTRTPRPCAARSASSSGCSTGPRPTGAGARPRRGTRRTSGTSRRTRRPRTRSASGATRRRAAPAAGTAS